jgi:hypothetical protein
MQPLQLLDLCVIPFAQLKETWHSNTIWRCKGVLRGYIHEETNVLQHENKDNLKEYLKYNITTQMFKVNKNI